MEGRVIAGRFRLEREVGAGAMGSVWRAEHLSLGVPVAVKLMSSESAHKKNSLARFEREARLAARIRSPYVVGVLDHGRDGELPYIVMEWLEGESLRERLDARQRLSIAETARVVTHVCRALGQAHELGLVHRDIKPENVFAARIDGDAGEVYKVLDFGIAKVTDEMAVDGVRTRTGALLGTPYYMSPEQARGLKTVDHRADLWSVGVVAFECLTGERPFSAKALGPLVFQIVELQIPTPSEVARDAGLSRELDRWVEQALRRDPAERFQNARELAAAFRLAAGVSERGDLDWSAVAAAPAAPSAVALGAEGPSPGAPAVNALAVTLVIPEPGETAVPASTPATTTSSVDPGTAEPTRRGPVDGSSPPRSPLDETRTHLFPTPLDSERTAGRGTLPFDRRIDDTGLTKPYERIHDAHLPGVTSTAWVEAPTAGHATSPALHAEPLTADGSATPPGAFSAPHAAGPLVVPFAMAGAPSPGNAFPTARAPAGRPAARLAVIAGIGVGILIAIGAVALLWPRDNRPAPVTDERALEDPATRGEAAAPADASASATVAGIPTGAETERGPSAAESASARATSSPAPTTSVAAAPPLASGGATAEPAPSSSPSPPTPPPKAPASAGWSHRRTLD